MKKSKMVLVLCIIMLCSLLVACGKTDTEDNLSNTEEINTNIENVLIKDSDTENIYKEYDAYFEFKSELNYDNTYVDGTVMDWTSWDRIGKDIYLEKSIHIYNQNKDMTGYTKENIDAYYIATNEEWSNIAIGENSFGVYVRTEELKEVMTEVDESIVENSDEVENTSPKVDEVIYTVTDMTKTMYAKQSVNLRSGPSTDYEKVGSLTTNQEVQITGKANTGWYRIDYNGSVAFVSNNYLSDTKVEVTQPNNGGNTNEGEKDSNEGYVPPTDNEDTNDYIEPTPEPTYTYTVDEVIAIVRNTMESNGIMWYPDVFPNSEHPSGGMSWGMDWVPMDDPYTYANKLVEGYLYQGFDLYYTEFLYTENGCVVLKTHFGSLPK